MLETLPSSQWNERTAAHLLNRAGFGGTPEEVRRLAALSPASAVDKLVDYQHVADDTPAPEWAKPDPNVMEYRRKMKSLSEEEKEKLIRLQRRTQRQQITELRGWWLERMMHGSRPFQEKMTLFWHGHFATSVQKVKMPYLMWLQNETFRRHATGSWRHMLLAVSKDPAMLIWLDGARSNKRQPNENYAREVMELFTLGEGHYSEADIREGARAFTGWTIGRDRQSFTYRDRMHDTGEKTFFGKTGKWKGEDIIGIILNQAQSDRFITAKLWEFFAGTRPDPAFNDVLATRFRGEGQSFAPLLKAMLRSREFYSDEVIRNQVKSPVQWLVGSVRMLERPTLPAVLSWDILKDLGQNLFDPPNVKGWDGGIAWITTANLLARYNHASRLVEGHQVGKKLDVDAMMQMSKQEQMKERVLNRKFAQMPPVAIDSLFTAEERKSNDALITAMERRLLNGEKLKPDRSAPLKEYLAANPKRSPGTIRHAIRLLMSTPDYQIT